MAAAKAKRPPSRPVKAGSKRAEDKRAVFLDALASGLSATGAAKKAGISRSTVYLWREKEPEFAQAWTEAEEAGTDLLEDEAFRRGHEGVHEPVYQGGKEVGALRKYSDTLMIFLLKARRPSKYRESFKAEISGPNGGPVELADTEREARILSLLALAEQRAKGGPDGSDDA